VQPRTGGQQYKGVWRSLVRMWKEEGFRGYMRGNGINCVRIVPYRFVRSPWVIVSRCSDRYAISAVQFTTYEQLKKVRKATKQ
jgi:solute carrier family 25 (mitochondrial phosphate transporter), member 23/24/25/41